MRRALYAIALVGALCLMGSSTAAAATCTPAAGANCYGSDLSGVNLSGADLTGINLRYANLTNANLSGANLSGASLSGATVTGANLTGATTTSSTNFSSLTGLSQTQVRALAGPGIFDNNNLSGMDLSGLNFTNADFYRANLSNANLSGSTLSSVSAYGVTLTNANLSSVNLTASYMPYADVTGAIFTNATTTSYTNLGYLTGLSETQIRALAGPAIFNGNNLDGMNLAGLNFSSADFDYASLRATNLLGANLTSSSIQRADLRNADLRSANLTSASFYSSQVAGAKFDGATTSSYSKLTGISDFSEAQVRALAGPAIFDYSSLTGMNLAGLNFTGADFQHSNLSGSSFRGSNLTNADADYANVKNVDVSGANLSGTTFYTAWVSGADFSGATTSSYSKFTGISDFSEAQVRALAGPAIFDSSLMAGMNLAGLNFTNADFNNTNLTGANLSGANLTSVSASSATMTDANLSNTNLSSASLYQASVAGANFSGAITSAYTRLTGISDFSEAQVKDLAGPAIFNYSVMAGMNLSGLNFTNADFDYASLAGANLSGSNLTSVSGYGVNLTNANLASINLSSASLYNAKLPRANLTGAQVGSARFSGAEMQCVVSSGVSGQPGSLPSGVTLTNGSFVVPSTGCSDPVATPSVSRTIALPRNLAVGEKAYFTALASSDSSTLVYAWDVDGDGFDDGSTRSLVHTFSRTGPQTARVKITNDQGVSTTRSFDVNPASSPPNECVTPQSLGVAFVYDNSYSMEYNDPTNLRGTAAEIGITQLPDDAFVSISTFGETAVQRSAPTRLTASSRPGLQRIARESVSLVSGTNYESAFTEAQRQLDAMPSSVDKKAVVFLSDGEPNSMNFLADQGIAEQGTPIFTVGFGQAPVSVMAAIAARSRAIPFVTQSAGASQAAFARIVALLTCDAKLIDDQLTLAPGETKSVPFTVSPTDREFRTLASWNSGSVEATLRRPDGSRLTVDPASQRAGETVYTGDTYHSATGIDPATGGWTLELKADSNAAKSVNVTIGLWKRTSADPPDAPALISPADGAQASSSEVEVSWRPARGASTYKLYVDDKLVRPSIGGQSATISGLTPGRHVWHVAAVNEFGETPSTRRVINGLPDSKPGETPPPVSGENLWAAKAMAPLLRQDSEEEWNVLDVDRYFAELGFNTGLLGTPWGEGSIQWKAIKTQGAGTIPKAYVRIIESDSLSYTWFNYWWYQSYNDGLPFLPGEGPGGVLFAKGPFDHWSDWEGLALGRRRGQKDASFDYAVLRGHEDPSAWKYLRGSLLCGLSLKPCGSPGASQRPMVFQSNGQHASYPRPCAKGDRAGLGPYNVPRCYQRKRLPESRSDGKGPLLFQDSENSVLPIDNREWLNIAGNWGPRGENAVNGPSHKGSDWNTPWIGRWQAKPAQLAGDRPGQSVDASNTSGECGLWAGPGIAASLCDENLLNAALASGRLGAGSAVTIDAPGAVADAPGISQASGEPLKPGDKLVVKGKASEAAGLLVKAEADGELLESSFSKLGLSDGKGRVVVKIAASGIKAQNESGKPIKPKKTARIDLRVAPKPRLRSVRKDGDRRIRVALKSPRSGRVSITVLDKSKASLLSKAFTVKGGRLTVKLPSGVKPDSLQISALNSSGYAGKTLSIKLR